ncbi:MAG: VWA domain-containing protein [Flavobacteriia bacterium]|nr:VWA domain-containing protein [Flavobacteriia bacterium]
MRTVFFFLIIALSQPIIGTKIKKIDSKNVEIVLALDVSNSMNTKDLSQNFSRLDIVKRALIQFLNQLSGEKIGISVFAGASYVQLPITEDYSAAKLFVNEISSTMISNQGTDISAAIQTAKNMFSEKKCNKIVLLMTDGEHHEGDLSESTEDIQQKELQFLVVGIGSKTGGFIPKVADRPEFGYKKDENSQNVVSKLNKNLIIDIAKQTHGSYTFINNSFPDIYHFFTSIKKSKSFQNSIEKNSIEMKVRKRFYSYFLLFSGGFLILFFLLNSLFYKKEKD